MTAAVTPVVCVGDLMTDVVAIASRQVSAGSDTASAVRLSGGGSAANTAAWLAATGHPVSYVGRAGDDLLGRSATADLKQLGVDVRVTVDPDRPTGVCVVLATPDGERSMFPDAGANAGLAPADLPADLFVAGRHLHLSGYALLTEGSRPAALASLALAKSAGMTVSVDPASAGPLAVVGVGRVLSWLGGADLLLANEDEACLLAGTPGDSAAAGAALAADFGAVVVKLGPAGAAHYRAGADVVSVPAAEAEVLDTTGAGDCFAAGFLPAWLAGSEPGVALAAGCALAARVVGKAGARP
jgi:ribokinase